ncbi:hypothetical protein ACJZ2D_012681 [Fusarium nematophilum]
MILLASTPAVVGQNKWLPESRSSVEFRITPRHPPLNQAASPNAARNRLFLAMSFHFVDSQAAGTPGARKAIRRHVMKGKNLGRTIRGRGRKHASTKNDGFFGDVPQEEKKDATRQDGGGGGDALVDRDGDPIFFPEIVPVDVPSSPSNHFTGSEYTYFAFPVQFTPSMRYMVHQFHTAVCDAIYPHAFCRPTDEIGAPWFRYMISDQAFLHCLLAMVATYLNLFRKQDCETLEATRHFSQALRLISQKLSQPTPPQDSTIAIVVSLSIHSKLIRDLSNSHMHLEGLQRILALRQGGLAQLREQNSALLHKICRTDIDLALIQGTRTRYGAVGGFTAAAAGPVAARALAYPLNQTCEALRQITREMLALCRRPGRASKMPALRYQDVLISLWQRLLDFAPLDGTRPADPLDDVWQLGLLAFLATVTHSTGCLRDIHCGLLRRMLGERVESDVLLARGDEYRGLWFWVVFVYAMMFSEEESGKRPVGKIRDMAEEMGLVTWDDVRARMRPFPWVGVVHDGDGKKLWESICPR